MMMMITMMHNIVKRDISLIEQHISRLRIGEYYTTVYETPGGGGANYDINNVQQERIFSNIDFGEQLGELVDKYKFLYTYIYHALLLGQLEGIILLLIILLLPIVCRTIELVGTRLNHSTVFNE